MKKATCNDLRGACDVVVTGESPEEMAQNCKSHVMSKLESGDQAHKDAVESMQSLSQEEQQKWYTNFVDSFSTLQDA